MKEYLKNFMVEFGYPSDCIDSILEDADKIFGSKEYTDKFNAILDRYKKDFRTNYISLYDDFIALSKEIGMEFGPMVTISHIIMSETLKEAYIKNDLPLNVWHDSVMDIKYHTLEGLELRGRYGAYVGYWPIGFYQLTRFALGRLQFEFVPLYRTYKKGDLYLRPVSQVINVHIPRTGEKLDPKAVNESCDLAKEFFKKYLNIDCNVFSCRSWLLFPDNLEVLKPDSNMANFIKMFDIYDVDYDPEYREIWRLFGKYYDPNKIDELPEDTSLRKAYKQWIKSGKIVGEGAGIMIR